MKKLLLSLILVAVSSSAAAEWILIGKNEKFRLYSNPATIVKSGSMVKNVAPN